MPALQLVMMEAHTEDWSSQVSLSALHTWLITGFTGHMYVLSVQISCFLVNLFQQDL